MSYEPHRGIFKHVFINYLLLLLIIMESSKLFDIAVEFMLKNEGGYSNVKTDKGGETNFGISKRQYPDLDIQNLTIEKAIEIYRRDYWNNIYEKINPQIAIRLFDLGVNMGVSRSVRLLQQSLIIHFDRILYVDGIFGPATLRHVNHCRPDSLYSALIFRASLYYESLRQSENFLGWLNRLYKKIEKIDL